MENYIVSIATTEPLDFIKCNGRYCINHKDFHKDMFNSSIFMERICGLNSYAWPMLFHEHCEPNVHLV